MDNKKINKVILFFVSSFFYFLVLFFGSQLILKSKGNDLPDTLVMMSLYFTLGATLLFFLQFDNLLNLFQKKAVKIALIIFPIFIVVMGYIFTLSKDLNDNIEKPNYEEQKKNQEIFNNSEIELDLSSINKNLVYKEYEDKLLSEGKDGTIRQFKEVSEDRLLDCTFELFLINDKKIIACDYNNSLNYYIKETEFGDKYYQLNINKQYLDKMDKKTLVELNSVNQDGTSKFEINGDTYYLIQSYTKLTLYKKFNSKFYYIINEWNLKKEVYKRNNVIEFETNRYYVRFIDSDYSMKLVIPKINENLELVLEYENQKR